MKKNSKLLALVIVFAMVMSITILPVSVGADSENIIGQITGISGDSTNGYTFTQTKGYIISEGLNNLIEWKSEGTSTLGFDNGVIKITNRNSNYAGIRYNYAGFKANHKYYVSACMRQDVVTTNPVGAMFSFSRANSNINLSKLDGDNINTKTSLVYNQWVTVDGIVEVPEDTTVTTDSNARTDRGAHIRFRADDKVDYSIKDISVIDITDKAFTATTTKSVASDSAEIGVTFSNAPESFTAANVEASGGNVAVTGSDKNYTISLTGLDVATTYTVTLKNVKDVYTQDLSGTVTSKFTTSETVLDTINRAANANINVTNGTSTGPDADGVYTFTKNPDVTGKLRSWRLSMPVTPDAYYVISAKIKTTDNNTTTNPMVDFVNVNLPGTNSNNNTINPCIAKEVVYGFNEKQFIGSDWTEVIGLVNITKGTGWDDADGDGRDDDSNSQAIHIDFETTATEIQIKDFQLRKVTALDYDNGYKAVVREDGTNANLYITGPASTIYYMAASYNNGKIADIQFKQLVLEEAGDVAFETLTKGDNYRFFIWDSNFHPLHKTFNGTDF